MGYQLSDTAFILLVSLSLLLHLSLFILVHCFLISVEGTLQQPKISYLNQTERTHTPSLKVEITRLKLILKLLLSHEGHDAFLSASTHLIQVASCLYLAELSLSPDLGSRLSFSRF